MWNKIFNSEGHKCSRWCECHDNHNDQIIFRTPDLSLMMAVVAVMAVVVGSGGCDSCVAEILEITRERF